MLTCEGLTGGAIFLVFAAALFYVSRKERYPAKLASRLAVTPVAQIQEGMVQVAGRAVGAATVKSAVLGLNCLVTRSFVEVYNEKQSEQDWETELRDQQSVPFFVEDASGRVWVVPEKAEFQLLSDLTLTTGEKWNPPESQRDFLSSLSWTGEGLEARIRDLHYELALKRTGLESLPGWMREGVQTGHERLATIINDPVLREKMRQNGIEPHIDPGTAQPQITEAEQRLRRAREIAKNVGKDKLRVTEESLLPGDPVYVIGPAFESPPGSQWAYPIVIRKEHPDDTFLIGEGTPDQVHGRVRKKSHKTAKMALVCLAISVVLILSCVFESGGG
ncbi:MAG: hypothetical protein EXQ56_07405 [Acidobacteria bacterium]|nr:hypothetical protein [Acidobacteriota bacterium]